MPNPCLTNYRAVIKTTALCFLLINISALTTQAQFKFQNMWTKLGDTLSYPCEVGVDGAEDALGNTCSVEVAVMNRQQNRIVTGAKRDGTTRMWDFHGNQLWSTGTAPEVECAAFSKDGTLVYLGAEDGKVTIRNTETGTVTGYLYPSTSTQSLDGMAMSPDGTILAGGDEDGRLNLWNVSNGTLLRSVQVDPDVDNGGPVGWEADVNSVQFTADGQYVMAAGTGQYARLYRVSDLALIRSFHHQLVIKSARISADGTKIATGGESATKVFDFNSGSLLATLSPSPTPISIEAVEFSPDSQYVFYGDHSKYIRIHQVTTGYPLVQTLDMYDTEYIQFSSDGALLLTAHEDGAFCLWMTNYKLVDDNANRGTTGQSALGYKSANNSLVTVENVPSSTDKSIFINNTSGHSGTLEAVRAFPVQSGGFLEESFKFRLSQLTTNVSLGYLEGSTGSSALMVYYDSASQRLKYYNGASLLDLPGGTGLVANTWYDMKILVDLDSRVHTIYFQDMATPKVTNAPLKSSTQNPAQIKFAVSDLAGANASAYFDNIVIRKDLFVNEHFENFQTGVTPFLWTVDSTSLITTQNVPSASDKSLFIDNTSGHVGNLSAKKAFTEQTAGTIVAQFKFKMSQTNVNVTLGIFENPTGTSATTVFHDGPTNKLRYYAGGTIYDLPGASGLVANTWYDMKVIANITNKTYSIYFQDMATAKVSNVSFRNLVNPAQIKFTVNDLSGTNVSAHFNNITVSKKY
jgi:WD40 repeat protein